MAISERFVVDATLMAIDEINAQGGLLGRPIQPWLLMVDPIRLFSQNGGSINQSG